MVKDVKESVLISNACHKCDTSSNDGDGITSKSCEAVACVINQNQSRTEHFTVDASMKISKAQKKRRGRKPKSSIVEDVSGQKECQTLRRVVSQDVPQRRSPRNTAEAREARSKSRSLRLKELHYIGEDICGQLSQEKQTLAALYLSEINRKLCSTGWKL